MANHDPNASLNEQSKPLLPTLKGQEDPNTQLLLQQPFASPTVARTPSVVTGGMDPSSFVNSLRRRWMLAIFMGLLIAGGVGFGIYMLFPESDTAEARFLVASKPQAIMDKKVSIDGDIDFDVFRATQLAQIQSYGVLRRAIDSLADADIKLLKKADDELSWLKDNLDVKYENDSEIMRVAITESVARKGGTKKELETILEAVCTAYLELVEDKKRVDRSKVGDALNANFSEIRKEIRVKWDEYQQLSKDLGIAEGQDPTIRMLFDKLKAKLQEKGKLEEEQRKLQLDFVAFKSMSQNPDLKEQQIDAQVSEDPNIQIMEQELLGLQAQLRDEQDRSRGRMNRNIEQLQASIERKAQQMQNERQQLRGQIKQQIATTPDISTMMYEQDYQRRLMMNANRLQQLQLGYDIETGEDKAVVRDMGIDEITKELEAKAEGSTELFIRKADLEQLERVATDLGRRLEAWNIESEADPRIQPIEEAHLVPGINRTQRILLSGLGAAATFLVTCLGIAYIEFLGRRLNGSKQVDEGLGIRVVGTLPKLKAKHQAQITESIDSVRTALMHESTTKQRQVVMITSPRTMEGRTTVASQLAGSLARAGRRTLLVDGDLRRPALHSLFNVPLEDGLCEVLRAEAEVADVVRATEAEGLWLMTAGYCDADAVHAMATDQIQPIFEKLRTEYDFVIIDGAPVLGLSDPLMMGQHCDGVLLSVLRDHTTVPDIYQSSELLRSVGIRMIGSVVNGVGTKVDRRVNHLQMAAPKSNRKQLEAQPAEAAVATKPETTTDEDFDFSDFDDKD